MYPLCLLKPLKTVGNQVLCFPETMSQDGHTQKLTDEQAKSGDLASKYGAILLRDLEACSHTRPRGLPVSGQVHRSAVGWRLSLLCLVKRCRFEQPKVADSVGGDGSGGRCFGITLAGYKLGRGCHLSREPC